MPLDSSRPVRVIPATAVVPELSIVPVVPIVVSPRPGPPEPDLDGSSTAVEALLPPVVGVAEVPIVAGDVSAVVETLPDWFCSEVA